MTFTEAVQTCFQKYVTISGRARRSEYWYFVLFSMLAGFVLGVLDGLLVGSNSNFQPLSTIFSLLILLPSLTVAIRRLHDRDMSGWWMLLFLVPLLGAIALFVIFALPGTAGRNRFGPDPLGFSSKDDEETAAYARSSIPRSGRE